MAKFKVDLGTIGVNTYAGPSGTTYRAYNGRWFSVTDEVDIAHFRKKHSFTEDKLITPKPKKKTSKRRW